MSEIRFWWVRHAPVVGNNGCCYGNNDVDCDVSDVASYKVLANILPKNAIYSEGGWVCKHGYFKQLNICERKEPKLPQNAYKKGEQSPY